MRILIVHNRYLQPGGEDESFAAEVAMLRAYGHQVGEYVEDNRHIATLGNLRTSVRTVWSTTTYRSVRRLIRDGRYDLVSVQNWFPLISPSVYYAARSMRVPVIQTLHNFRLYCVNGLFFRDGRVCEDCLGRRIAWPGIAHACYRNSRAGSAVLAVSLALHRLAGTWSRAVDRYVALNQFVRDKYISAGLPPALLVVKPNFLAEDPGISTSVGDYALFAGRVSAEKGLDIVVDAWARLGNRAPVLRILGRGPDEAALRAKTAADPNITWIGQCPNPEVIRQIQSARAVILASRWYENFPRVILEAFACGVPVIAPRLGAMATLVRHGVTGLLFDPGNAEDLAERVEWLWAHPAERGRMAASAREEFLTRYTADINHVLFQDIVEGLQQPQPPSPAGARRDT